MRPIMLLAVLCLCAPAFAAPVPKEQRKGSFEGLWKLESAVQREKDCTEQMPPYWAIDSKGAVLHLSGISPEESKAGVLFAELAIDHKQSLVDFMYSGRSTGADAALGIFKFEGDTLKICVGSSSRRPDALSPEIDTTVWTLKRVRAKTK